MKFGFYLNKFSTNVDAKLFSNNHAERTMLSYVET